MIYFVACGTHHACNMNWHEMAYSHFICTGHCVEWGVCAWYWLFTILGECVVSSEIGTTSEIETHECIK